jgi:hypothetical protein
MGDSAKKKIMSILETSQLDALLLLQLGKQLKCLEKVSLKLNGSFRIGLV